MKKIITLSIIAGVVAVGLWFFLNKENAPLNTETDTLAFDDIKVADTLKLDDGNPQTNDSEFVVTWEVRGGSDLNASNVLLNFAVVDENDNEVTGHLYGAGVGSSFKDKKWTLRMPPLCSSVPVDGCFPNIDLSKRYRLKATGVMCSDTNVNPAYCSNQSRTLTNPAYSNWFSISSDTKDQVGGAPATKCAISASPKPSAWIVGKNNQVTLSWTSENGTSAYLYYNSGGKGGDIVDVATKEGKSVQANGSENVTITLPDSYPTNYTLVVKGPKATVVCNTDGEMHVRAQ